MKRQLHFYSIPINNLYAVKLFAFRHKIRKFYQKLPNIHESVGESDIPEPDAKKDHKRDQIGFCVV